MNDDMETLKDRGMLSENVISRWRDVASEMAALEAIGRSGASVVVKVDGGRENGAVFTIVVSGGILGEEFYRKDGTDLRTLVQEGIAFFVEKTKEVRL